MSMLNDRLNALEDYPFTRLRTLLTDIPAPEGRAAIDFSIGDPKHAPPALLTEAMAAAADSWNRYPPIAGTYDWRQAVSDWLVWRFGEGGRLIDPDVALLPASGTREALFMLASACVGSMPGGNEPAVLLPNPFYGVYVGAAQMTSAEPVFLTANRQTGFLPDLDALPASLLDRTALFYLCSPANPQGAAADVAYLQKALSLARRHGFVLAVDECYSEIYHRAPPTGVLEVAARFDGARLDNLIVFNSLSKRSSAAGLRSGFVAGDPTVIAAFRRLRGYASAGMPMPIQAASAALWRDEAHVTENRELYRAKIDTAERIMGDSLGFYRPDAGFFLWLEVGDGERAAERLWREQAIRVLPGAYIGRPAPEDGNNPGQPFMRLALVHDIAVVADALTRLMGTFSAMAGD